MKALKYLPGFTFTHLKNAFRHVEEQETSREDVSKPSTLIFEFGLETFELHLTEDIDTESYRTLITLIGQEGNFDVLPSGRQETTIRQKNYVSRTAMVEMLTSVFNFLIEEGNKQEVFTFLERHQTWLVALWSCINNVYFVPGIIPETVILVDEEFYLQSVYSVVA